jgi:hypothetical protein
MDSLEECHASRNEPNSNAVWNDFKIENLFEEQCIDAGLVGGVCLCVLVACIEYFTLNILARHSAIHRSTTFQGLVRCSFSFQLNSPYGLGCALQ